MSSMTASPNAISCCLDIGRALFWRFDQGATEPAGDAGATENGRRRRCNWKRQATQALGHVHAGGCHDHNSFHDRLARRRRSSGAKNSAAPSTNSTKNGVIVSRAVYQPRRRRELSSTSRYQARRLTRIATRRQSHSALDASSPSRVSEAASGRRTGHSRRPAQTRPHRGRSPARWRREQLSRARSRGSTRASLAAPTGHARRPDWPDFQSRLTWDASSVAASMRAASDRAAGGDGRLVLASRRRAAR